MLTELLNNFIYLYGVYKLLNIKECTAYTVDKSF
jgi:hypothetical protein